MKNLNASLVELTLAEKKKLTFIQEFLVYRRKIMMELFIREESKEANNAYAQLTNATEYEDLLGNLQREIEKVASHQAEFWAQVGNALPDLNILRNLSNQMYNATRETEYYWDRMNQINPNYKKALTIYGNFMKDIKNNIQLAQELEER
jgi:DNA repair ATPase RecN